MVTLLTKLKANMSYEHHRCLLKFKLFFFLTNINLLFQDLWVSPQDIGESNKNGTHCLGALLSKSWGIWYGKRDRFPGTFLVGTKPITDLCEQPGGKSLCFFLRTHHFLFTAQVSWVMASHLCLWHSQASQSAASSLVPGGISHNLSGVTLTLTWFPEPRDRRSYAACGWWNQTHNQTSSGNRSPTWNSRSSTFPQPHTANILRTWSSEGLMTV